MLVIFSFFVNENPKILKSILIVSGGLLNLEDITKASDFANFLPNINKVISFFIIKSSTPNE